MKAITIKQPFASLIAAGIKEYEFRTWKTKYRGELLIHAGKGIDKKAMKKFEAYGLEYPSGCIVAKAYLSDCIEVDDKFRKILVEKNPEVYHSIVKHDEWEGYGFKLESVKKIEPIPAKGKLSIWEIDLEKDVIESKEDEDAVLTMYHTYVMGIDNSIFNLEKHGFLIREDGNNYTVSFPESKAELWEDFIKGHLEIEYWNEYLTEDKVIFIFHLEDGFKRYEVNNYTNDEVLSLCEKLCDCKFESIKKMLSDNSFYKTIIK